MSPILAVLLLLFGGVAGYVGWRRATRPIYRRSLYDADPPHGMSRREYERIVRRRRKIKRVFVTLAYAATGAIVGLVLLLFIARH